MTFALFSRERTPWLSWLSVSLLVHALVLLCVVWCVRADDGKAMNAGGIPYSIGNGAAGSAEAYATDFSKLGDYFDVYGEVQTRYSQVYWKRNDPVPLPDDVVARFDGKVMAVTGYEADQVMMDPTGGSNDQSIPIYHAYNHHYFAWLTGEGSEWVRLDEPTLIPDPTFWDVVDSDNKTHAYPTNIVFKENPGGEYRKSYHGYPQGFAQLIHSPREFVLEPMQIDTHNREVSPSATNESGHHEWFLPRMVTEGNMTMTTGGLSPLIECPCSDRIARTIVNTSSVVTSGTCPSTVASEAECTAAVASMVNLHASSTVSDSGRPSGCIMVPVDGGPTTTTPSYDAVFNSLSDSSAVCGNSETVQGPLNGAAASLVNVTVSVDAQSDNVTIGLSGPSDVWFGVGFDAKTMADAPYAIIVTGNGSVSERRLVDHGPGTLLDSSLTLLSNAVTEGVRTVVATRRVAGKDEDFYSFPTLPSRVDLIDAVGSTPDLSYHKSRTGASLSLVPTTVPSCLCAPTSTSYLAYMNESMAEYNVDCEPEPRGDMLQQHNPACNMTTYHGGLQCCHHEWFLTDRAQADQIPDDVDTYYLKFRYYFQEFSEANATAPASHQHMSHWVFLIDAQVNDYEEVQCDEGELCRAMITARLPARDMGLEDIPSNYSGITPLVITAHCHAPSCIAQELYNADTGELLCRAEAQYGKSDATFDEANYIALPPCLFGHEVGLRKPFTLAPDTNLQAIKYFNTSYRHLGQMAQWTGLMVYEP